MDYPPSVVVYCFTTAAPLLTKQILLTDSRPSGRPAWIVMTLLVHPDWSYLPQISSRPIWHVLFFRSIVVTGTGNFDHVKFSLLKGCFPRAFLRRFIPAPLLRRGKLDSWKSLLTHHAETQLLNSLIQKPVIHSIIGIYMLLCLSGHPYNISAPT